VIRRLLAAAAAPAIVVALAPAASATPVCTDGYMGGPPLARCGNRIFPEAALTQPGSSTVKLNPDPVTGFKEFDHGVEFLAQKYPRWVKTYNLSDRYGPLAKSAGPDDVRPYEDGDSGDGREIRVIEITDHSIPNAGKETLFFSLSVHGNERGGLEGGLRAAEDLAMAAENGGTIVDGYPNYTSNTGKEPEFHEYEVAEVLAKEVVYLVDFNPDGWAQGEVLAGTGPGGVQYARGNSIGTDLNRQMPTVGRIAITRNPLQESELRYGTKFMHEVADAGKGGLMAYGADIHGELTSRAYVDIMYPAGQFDSVKHRQLMAIAERTTSVIDETLYAGIQNEIEEATGGNEGEGIEDLNGNIPKNTIPTKPAHWATVWDTLGYTDTGFIGDYLAAELGVTGMDYEIFLNHIYPHANQIAAWNPYLVENHINASRAIIKTAMAYALTQSLEFNDDNVVLDTGGQAGYVVNPVRVTDKDANGPGTLPGPDGDGIGADGQPVVQKSYDVSNQQWFTDTSRLMPKPFLGLKSADVANDPKTLDQLDTLVLADVAVPKDVDGRPVDEAKYYANLKAWVEKGGNLVLTDRAIHTLGKIGVVAPDAVSDIQVYQPYSDISNFENGMVTGLRRNARQLVEAAILGYEIGGSASPMTAVEASAFTEAGGVVVGTTPNSDADGRDDVTLGELPLGKGLVRVVGGALPTPTEENDHRFGLKAYGLTYSGLFIMENVVRYDAAGLGAVAGPGFSPPKPQPGPSQPRPAPPALPATGGEWELAAGGVALLAVATRIRQRRRRRA
jgi:hypothetical protein